VEDGRPFCSQCRAPQIHVQVAAPPGEAEAAGDAPSGQSDTLVEDPDFGRPPTLQQSLFDRNLAARCALKAGVIGVLLLFLVPFVGVVLTGSLAVYLYRRVHGFVPVTGIASRLGAAAGLVSFAIYFVIVVISERVLHGQQAYVDFILKGVQVWGSKPADADFLTVAHFMATPAGLAFTFLFGSILPAILAAAGGALAAVFLRRTPRA
jgi:hypothetical protein